jgi:myo-inositol-1-phosphate synthase
LGKIKIAIIGLGNCASSLLQGIEYCRGKSPEEVVGLMHWDLGGYRPSDIEIVAAFDIDRRKVGLDVHDAIFSRPNCTVVFQKNMPRAGVKVTMGRILDGIATHMSQYDEDYTFAPEEGPEASKEEVVAILRKSKAHMLLNYLPVGSEEATRFYVECALEAGIGFVNNIPVFIASDPAWAARFAEKKLPIVGDDIKAQVGATITHRVLTDLFKKRGVKLDRTYQLNTGGNTDFLNMLNRTRLRSKKESKTEAVQSVTASRMEQRNIHVGPSDYVPWQNDQKVCFIRMEGQLFGGVPMNLELRLSVEDSPNSAGVVIDAIRCCKVALDRGVGGVLSAPSAYFCKHPAKQYTDDVAYQMVEDFIHARKTAPQTKTVSS